MLRIVTIEDLDRSACGGTHVRSTGEIGPVLLRKLDKVRQAVRIEFLCGMRAVRRARADFDALSRIAQLFSAPLDETPALVASQQLASGGGDENFLEAKIITTRFYGDHIITLASGFTDAIITGSDAVLQMEEAYF